MLKNILISILLFAVPGIVFGSQFNWKLTIDGENKTFKSIGDGEYRFKVGDWDCQISETTKYSKNNESRRLGCSLQNGLEVYIKPTCGKSAVLKKFVKYDSASFNLQQSKSASRLVMWLCKQ